MYIRGMVDSTSTFEKVKTIYINAIKVPALISFLKLPSFIMSTLAYSYFGLSDDELSEEELKKEFIERFINSSVETQISILGSSLMAVDLDKLSEGKFVDGVINRYSKDVPAFKLGSDVVKSFTGGLRLIESYVRGEGNEKYEGSLKSQRGKSKLDIKINKWFYKNLIPTASMILGVPMRNMMFLYGSGRKIIQKIWESIGKEIESAPKDERKKVYKQLTAKEFLLLMEKGKAKMKNKRQEVNENRLAFNEIINAIEDFNDSLGEDYGYISLADDNVDNKKETANESQQIGASIFNIMSRIDKLKQQLKTQKEKIQGYIANSPIQIKGKGIIYNVEGGETLVSNKNKLISVLKQKLNLSDEAIRAIIRMSSTPKTIKSYIKAKKI
jgi:hypothetical protein